LIVLDGVHHLPSTFSIVGASFNHPPDIRQGETMYDLFAFDVACLGASRAFLPHCFLSKIEPSLFNSILRLASRF
jgi:hypothetical protein